MGLKIRRHVKGEAKNLGRHMRGDFEGLGGKLRATKLVKFEVDTKKFSLNMRGDFDPIWGKIWVHIESTTRDFLE